MFSATTNERLRIEYEFADFSYKSDSERAVKQVEDFLNANAERFLVKGLYSYFVENEAGFARALARWRADPAFLEGRGDRPGPDAPAVDEATYLERVFDRLLSAG